LSAHDFSNENFPPNSAAIIQMKDLQGEAHRVRALRVSFVGELGFELHIPKESCAQVYNMLMRVGGSLGLKNAGYRSMYSLSSEKGSWNSLSSSAVVLFIDSFTLLAGYHLWGFDLRSDDTPLEANLGFICRKNGDYKGKIAVTQQQIDGIHKRLVFLTLKEKLPVWGLEAVYRDGEIVGHLRRGDWAYSLNCAIGQSYIRRHNSDKPIDIDYIKSGKYQVEVMGKLYDAECHLRSPFDPKGRRILGDYKS
jgi:sarcosine dehydrogenase